MDELISRIKLQEGNTEFWKRRFLGEGLNGDHGKPMDADNSESVGVLDDDDDVDVDVVEDAAKEVEDDEADADDDEEEEEEVEVEVEVEQTESQDVERVKNKEVEAKKPLQMIGVQLLKDSDQTTATSKKSRRRSMRKFVEV